MEPTTMRLTYSVGNSVYSCIDDGDPSGACSVAVAYVCPLIPPYGDRAPNCDRFVDVARNVMGNETYFNPNFMEDDSHFEKVSTFAHELGHTLRLSHHSGGVCLMNAGFPRPSTPNSLAECDLGISDPFNDIDPCDRDTDKWGIRCIFAWWREQSPTLDCYDVDRNGIVLIPDITQAQLAYGGTAGEKTYHPDADTNRDGFGRIQDVTDVVNQYGDNCNQDHYNHS
jgi:hypothetical protein